MILDSLLNTSGILTSFDPERGATVEKLPDSELQLRMDKMSSRIPPSDRELWDIMAAGAEEIEIESGDDQSEYELWRIAVLRCGTAVARTDFRGPGNTVLTGIPEFRLQGNDARRYNVLRSNEWPDDRILVCASYKHDRPLFPGPDGEVFRTGSTVIGILK